LGDTWFFGRPSWHLAEVFKHPESRGTPTVRAPRPKDMRRHGQPDALISFECVNCGEPLDGPGAVLRGPDTAWHGQCRSCHGLVADQVWAAEERH
jgi:hypothetical protein